MFYIKATRYDEKAFDWKAKEWDGGREMIQINFRGWFDDVEFWFRGVEPHLPRAGCEISLTALWTVSCIAKGLMRQVPTVSNRHNPGNK